MALTAHAPSDDAPRANAAHRPRPRAMADVLLVGAGGPLGGAVLQALLGRGAVAALTQRPIGIALPGLVAWPLPADTAADRAADTAADEAFAPAPDWPRPPTTAVVVFDRELSRRGREAAFYRPEPARLPALARWLQRGGVRRLVLLLPQAPALLPQALRQGLATLDEQAVAALGFEQLAIVRPARLAPAAAQAPQGLHRLARALLAQLHWMLPQREQPLRAERIAQFVADLVAALTAARPATRVAAPEQLWDWAQPGGGSAWLQAWLNDQPLPAVAPPPPMRW